MSVRRLAPKELQPASFTFSEENLAWARKELALTTHGKLVVVPGAGHSVQSRAVSDVGRRAVARFLLGS